MRSVALESLLRHLPAGPRYFGLQHNRSELEAAALAKAAITDLSPDLKHFGETAAACLAMNLIVSVDTSVAHLAGALGLPTWVLLTTPTDWRWGTESATQQWYPQVSTLRGRTEDGWPTVLKELADRLQGEFSRWSDRSRA